MVCFISLEQDQTFSSARACPTAFRNCERYIGNQKLRARDEVAGLNGLPRGPRNRLKTHLIPEPSQRRAGRAGNVGGKDDGAIVSLFAVAGDEKQLDGWTGIDS